MRSLFNVGAIVLNVGAISPYVRAGTDVELIAPISREDRTDSEEDRTDSEVMLDTIRMAQANERSAA